MVPTPPARPPGPDRAGAPAGPEVDGAGRVEEAVEAALAALAGGPAPTSDPGPARRAATVIEALLAARSSAR